ncbi:MAG: pseudaminic acid cytidylyltransferase [Cyclobacteriaceae bacterium]
MKNLAIIPARGGSKRIPGKNTKLFAGKPILHYSIEAAIQSNCFDEIMVSTDSPEIADAAKQSLGAAVPFLRSEKTANDTATLADVILEVLHEYKIRGKVFDHCCCILPTAPFIQSEKIVQGLDRLMQNEFDSVMTIVRFDFPIQRSLAWQNGKVQMVWPEYTQTRSQDLEARYHDCGQFYWIKPEIMLKKQSLFTDNSGAIELPASHVQDIDTEEDWKMAEFKFAYFNGKL